MAKKMMGLDLGRYSFHVVKGPKHSNYDVDNEIHQKYELENAVKQSMRNYEDFISYTDLSLKACPDEDARVNMINYLMMFIRKSLQMELVSEVFLKQASEISRFIKDDIVPCEYVDEQGTTHKIEPTGRKKINIRNTTTIVVPWDRDKMKNAILDTEADHTYEDFSQHNIFYFAELDICYALNGNHSLSASILNGNGKGELMAEVYHVQPLFDHVYTDGQYWYNIHTDNKIGYRGRHSRAFDYRAAILFELAKRKNNLTKEIPTD